MHLNIESIVSKLDIIEGETSAYDVLVFSESWLNRRIPNASICIERFSPPFRADRPDRLGGGVIVYVRDTLPSKRRTDLEIPGLEAAVCDCGTPWTFLLTFFEIQTVQNSPLRRALQTPEK